MQKFDRVDVIEQELADTNLSKSNRTALAKELVIIEGELYSVLLTDYIGSLSVIGLYVVMYFLYLPSLSKYGVLRYQMGHVRWRGIRGHQEGSPYLFPFLKWFHILLTLLTLGIWMPFGDSYLTKYKLNKLYFGSQKGEHRPAMEKLFLSHLLTSLLFIFTLGISRFWYKASLARMHVNDFKLSTLAFKTSIEGHNLLFLKFGNFFILIFTLGIGYPIILQRNMKFMAEHIYINGDLDAMVLEQAQGTKPMLGEGVSHWIDVGAGFGTGYLFLYY